MNKKVFLNRYIFILILSTILLSIASIYAYRVIKNNLYADDRFIFKKIISQTASVYKLPVEYIESLLDLSHGARYGELSSVVLESKIISSPVIFSANVNLIKPDTIFVSYTPLLPVANILDINNAAIDDRGTVFPLYPYFTPKKIPDIYLGLSYIPNWKEILCDEKVGLALSVIHMFQSEERYAYVELLLVDVSGLDADNAADRELIIQFKYDDKLYTLRLDPDEYLNGLNRYSQLYNDIEFLSYNDIVIDLRLEGMAFVRGKYEN